MPLMAAGYHFAPKFIKLISLVGFSPVSLLVSQWIFMPSLAVLCFLEKLILVVALICSDFHGQQPLSVHFLTSSA